MHDNEFDLIVKNLIEDAEVKPSPRVWKAVSECLSSSHPQAQARRAALVWPAWATAAIAFACLLVGIFIFYPGKEIPEQNTIALVERAMPENDNRLADILENKEFTNREELVISPIRDFEKPTEAIVIEIAKPLSKEDNASTQENEKQQSREPKTPKAISTGEQASRYFAQLELEDKASEKGHKASLYAKGAVGSNDGFNSTLSHGFYAPGASSETEIKESSSSNYGIPLSFGIGARFYILPRFSIGTGLNLNILNRSFTGTLGQESGNVRHRLVYLGIPINLYYDFVDFENLKFYAYAGAEAEMCLSNKYIFHSTPNIQTTNPVKQLQYSVSAGLGIEFSVSKLIGIYIDPGVQYYFDCNQPTSVRTVRPLIFSFDAGLRFNF